LFIRSFIYSEVNTGNKHETHCPNAAKYSLRLIF